MLHIPECGGMVRDGSCQVTSMSWVLRVPSGTHKVPMFMGPVPTDAGRLLAAQEKECLAGELLGFRSSGAASWAWSDESNTLIYTL